MHWFKQKIDLLPELMPEPYIGDPHNCSVVIMNYYPGAANYKRKTEEDIERYRNDAVHYSGLDNPERMCYHYARNYRERVAAGGYLGRDVDPMYKSSLLDNVLSSSAEEVNKMSARFFASGMFKPNK